MTQQLQAEQDERFMQRALELAAATVSLASPNPQVGCVLVKAGEIIAEGAHLYDHRDHAEIVALKQALHRGIDPAGATAYVTLEPCAHHGRTAPCADALIEARIARCVVATEDPNPLVGGQGIVRLRDAGVEVAVGTLQQQARDLNDAFACFIQERVPFVTLKAALSADGKLAPPPGARIAVEPHWLTGPQAREQVQRLRHGSDAILTGIGTVLADDPALTDRTGLPRRRPLLRVILDTQLRTPLNSHLVRSAAGTTAGTPPDLLILCGESAPTEPERAFEAAAPGRVEVIRLPLDADGRLSLTAVLAHLAERNILSLLLECGARVNGAFLTQHLVDKVVLFYGQSTLGGSAIPFAAGIDSPALVEASLQRLTRAAVGLDTVVSGYLDDPWPAD